MLAWLVCTVALSQQGSAPVVPDISLNLSAPFEKMTLPPDSFLRYRLGSRISTYRDQERYFSYLEGLHGKKIKRIDYGNSTAGLPLRVFAISSEENIARLDQIRQEHEQVALGKSKLSPNQPAIVWINECIHGNEPASFESAMALAYNLLAGRGAASDLKNVVVILNPSYNPDGHERFAVYYNSVARGASDFFSFEFSEPSAVFGRTNQYRFDMNRDRVSFSQKETQQEVALMYKWRPQVYVDQHGQVENYFMPPNPMSINANVDRTRLNKWTELFGRATASEFDRAGWSYFIRSAFDLYYPGYLDTHTTLAGAIGMTHETDGGKTLNKARRDGSIVSYREGIAKHLTSALAVINASAKNKDALLKDWAEYKRKAVTGEHAGTFKRVVLQPKSPNEALRIGAHLKRSGIAYSFLGKPLKQAAHDFWSEKNEEVEFQPGAIVVDMAQENGPLAKTLFETVSDFEPEFIKAQQEKKKTAPDGERYPGPEGIEFYDTTAWSLPYLYNVDAWWCESTPEFTATDKVLVSSPFEKQSLGYVLEYKDDDAVLAIADLLQQDVRVLMAKKSMTLGKYTFRAGSFVIFRARNDDSLDQKLADVSRKRNVFFRHLPTSYPEEMAERDLAAKK